MNKLRHNVLTCFLVIFALVTAGVSPACAFISGKMTMIEICGADGMMKVAVPADELPDEGAKHERAPDCGFCIAHASGKALTTPDTAIIDFSFVYDTAPVYQAVDFMAPVLDGRLHLRGPPASL